MAKRKIRVAVMGVGYTGSTCIHAMLVKGVEVVAGIGHIHNLGKDIGELAGLDPIGVPLVPREQMAEVLDRTKPDILLDCTSNSMEELYPGVKMCFERGIHVMSLGTLSFYPKMNNPEMTAELDALGKAHNCCFLNSSSGEVWQGLTTMLSANSESITKISIMFYALLDSFGESIAEEVGIGLPPERWPEIFDVNKARGNGNRSMWNDVSTLLAEQLGLHVKSMTQRMEPLAAQYDQSPASISFPIKKGTLIGRDAIIETETEEGISIRTCSRCKFSENDEQCSLICDVEGVPNLHLKVDDFYGHIATSTIMVNRIPDLFRCEPGMRVTNDFPAVTYQALSEYWIDE